MIMSLVNRLLVQTGRQLDAFGGSSSVLAFFTVQMCRVLFLNSII